MNTLFQRFIVTLELHQQHSLLFHDLKKSFRVMALLAKFSCFHFLPKSLE